MDAASNIAADKLQTNFSDVQELFTLKEDGFGDCLDTLIENFIRPNGFLVTRTKGMNRDVQRLEDRKADMEVRIGMTEQRLRTQFRTMDILVGKLRSTSTYLTQQFGRLNSNLSQSQR